MATSDFIDYNLDLYLDYEYLTVEQYSSILTSFNNIYNEIIKITTLETVPEQELSSIIAYFQNPLCVEEIHTGNSITTKISLERRLFPRFSVENDDTLKIQLPRWTAALFLTGLIISYGVDKYEKILDIQIKQLDAKIKSAELKKLESEVTNQSKQIQSESEIAKKAYHQMQQNHYLFQAQIQQGNINRVTLNGGTIKDKNSETKRQLK